MNDFTFSVTDFYGSYYKDNVIQHDSDISGVFIQIEIVCYNINSLSLIEGVD